MLSPRMTRAKPYIQYVDSMDIQWRCRNIRFRRKLYYIRKNRPKNHVNSPLQRILRPDAARAHAVYAALYKSLKTPPGSKSNWARAYIYPASSVGCSILEASLLLFYPTLLSQTGSHISNWQLAGIGPLGPQDFYAIDSWRSLLNKMESSVPGHKYSPMTALSWNFSPSSYWTHLFEQIAS